MKPWQKAKQWQLEHSDVPFEELLGVYMSEGYVWSSNGSFILARDSFWDGEKLHVGNNIEANAYAVQLAAGLKPLNRFLEIAPRPLKYVAWQRRGSEKWHVWEWDKFKQKVKQNG